jgi:hypothetical protein
MENIKAKDLLIKSINNEEFVPLTTRPERPKKVFAESRMTYMRVGEGSVESD